MFKTNQKYSRGISGDGTFLHSNMFIVFGSFLLIWAIN